MFYCSREQALCGLSALKAQYPVSSAGFGCDCKLSRGNMYDGWMLCKCRTGCSHHRFFNSYGALAKKDDSLIPTLFFKGILFFPPKRSKRTCCPHVCLLSDTTFYVSSWHNITLGTAEISRRLLGNVSQYRPVLIFI